MTDEQYHASKSLSKSAIDLLLECPALYKAWYENIDDTVSTPALRFGSMVHKLTLEPQLFDNDYAVTTLDLTTKAGREFKASVPKGKTIVKDAEYEAARMMADAVRDHPQAKYLFDDYLAEQAIFWERDGIECKAKPDIIAKRWDMRFIADLKTTDSANPESIRRSIAKYHYYRQASWYLDGMARIGEPCDAFIFVFVEKTYPYLVTLCQLDQAALDKGREECERAVEILKECRRSGQYPCYTREILTVSLPNWAA